MAEWETWLRDQDDWNGDQAYRGIYAAWSATSRAATHRGECSLVEQPDGSFLLSTNGNYEPLRLADADACREFSRWLAERLCNTGVPTMRAWEERQHETYVYELKDRLSWGDG